MSGKRESMHRLVEIERSEVCHRCGSPGKRHVVVEVEKIDLWGKVVKVVNGRYKCLGCGKFFTVSKYRTGKYTGSVVRAACRIFDTKNSYEVNIKAIENEIGLRIPGSTLCDWLRDERERVGRGIGKYNSADKR